MFRGTAGVPSGIAHHLVTGPGGLLVRSFVRLRTIDPGFRADHVLTASVDLAERAYQTGFASFTVTRSNGFAVLPGVSAQGAIN